MCHKMFDLTQVCAPHTSTCHSSSRGGSWYPLHQPHTLTIQSLPYSAPRMNKRAIKTDGVREQCVMVSDAISSTIHTLLGPGTKFKCLIDGDGEGLVVSFFYF